MSEPKRKTLSLPARSTPDTEAEPTERRRPPVRGANAPRPRASASDPKPAKPAPRPRRTERTASEGAADPRRDERRPAAPRGRRDENAPRSDRTPARRDASGMDRPRTPRPPAGDGTRPAARPRRFEEQGSGDAPRRFRDDAARPAPRRDETDTRPRRTPSERTPREAYDKREPARTAAPREERRRFGVTPAGDTARERPPSRQREEYRSPQHDTRPRRPRGDATDAARPRVERAAETQRAADPSGSLRLSKRMAELGLCSRREADEYIERGWVKVDGVVVDTLGAKVTPEQTIELARGAEVAQNQRVTVILNKPIGYVSGQAEDGYEPASVLITAENRWDEDPVRRHFETRHMRKLAPAGRLDIDSTGMLVLTQDGRIAKHLIGEHSDVEKEYLVRVEGTLSPKGLQLLNHGLELDGVELRPAKVSWQNEDQLRFVLREGRKRQIRRMCELVGLHVVGLKRVRIGRVKLAKLPPGKWRYLADNEEF